MYKIKKYKKIFLKLAKMLNFVICILLQFKQTHCLTHFNVLFKSGEALAFKQGIFSELTKVPTTPYCLINTTHILSCTPAIRAR